jgi:Glycosyltransferases involved in cell wall biogenesis
MEEQIKMKEEDEIVDIIIPVYNQEKLIKRCIESVLSQTFKNWNMILVNDGSSDQSAKICSYYQSINKNITYIEKKNEGVSAARNDGLKYVKGSKLIFLDADDYIEENYIELLLENMQEFDLIITCNYCIDAYGNIKSENEPLEVAAVGKENMIAYIFNKQCFRFFTAPWGKMYKYSIINDYKLEFRDIDYGEDMCFVFDYLSHSSGVRAIKGSHYFYLDSGYSLSRRPIENIWGKLRDVNNYSMKSFYNKYDDIWNYMFFRIIKVALMNDLREYKKYKNMLSEIIMEDDFKRIDKEKIGDLSDRLMYVFLRYLPKGVTYLLLKLYCEVKNDRHTK